MRGYLGKIATFAVAGLVLAGAAALARDAAAQTRTASASIDLVRGGDPARPTQHWRTASQFPITLPETGTLLLETVGHIESLSRGAVRFDIREPDDGPAPDAILDAVASGAFQAAFVWPATLKGRTAVFELYGGIPFGPSAADFLAWHEQSGANLRQELYHAHNLHGLLCGMVAGGGSWFRVEIARAGDLELMPIAAAGLARRALIEIGATPQTLTPGDTGLAYRNGKIAGAIMLNPSIDRQIMRGAKARRYVFPSWSHNWAGLDLIVNLGAWRALASLDRLAIENVCAANIATSLPDSEAAQVAVLKDMIKEGIDVRRLPAPFLDALRAAWERANANLQRDDPDYRRAWASLAAFRKTNVLWRELTSANSPAEP